MTDGETNGAGEREDRAALREVTRSLYAAISGPAGAPRDWAAQAALFADAAGIAVLHRGADDRVTPERLDLARYRATRAAYFAENDFHEVEVEHRAEIAGRVAVVVSVYESRRTPDGPAFERGVNTLQLVKSAGRWLVVAIAWEAGAAAQALRSA